MCVFVCVELQVAQEKEARELVDLMKTVCLSDIEKKGDWRCVDNTTLQHKYHLMLIFHAMSHLFRNRKNCPKQNNKQPVVSMKILDINKVTGESRDWVR